MGDFSSSAIFRFVLGSRDFATRVGIPKTRGVCGTLTTILINTRCKVDKGRVARNVNNFIPNNVHRGVVEASGCAVVGSYCGTDPTSVHSKLGILKIVRPGRRNKQGVTILNGVLRLNSFTISSRGGINGLIGRRGVSYLMAINSVTGGVTTNTVRTNFREDEVRRFAAGARTVTKLGNLLRTKSYVLVGNSENVHLRRVTSTLCRSGARRWVVIRSVYLLKTDFVLTSIKKVFLVPFLRELGFNRRVERRNPS